MCSTRSRPMCDRSADLGNLWRASQGLQYANTMARPSPQTDRVRWTLNLLASRPREAFNLAQIARHLGVSKATCLPMVAALTSAGWLVRHPTHKTYRLGPALVTLGRAAESASALDDLALPMMVELSRASGLPCLSWTRSGDHLLLADVVNAQGKMANWTGLKRGHRLTPAPPMGSCLVAWSDTLAVEAWLRRAHPSNLESARVHYAPALAATRARGYVVELRHPLEHQVFLLTQRLTAEHSEVAEELLRLVAQSVQHELAEREVLPGDIDPDGTYLPVSINAPVFGAMGEIELVICLTDAPEPMSGRALHRLGCLVRDATSELTEMIGGSRLPAESFAQCIS